MRGFGIAVFPRSWHLALFSVQKKVPYIVRKKTILAIGPLRFIVYHNPGKWVFS